MARPETVDEDEHQVHHSTDELTSSEETTEAVSGDDETSSSGSSSDETDSDEDGDGANKTETPVPSLPSNVLNIATSPTDLKSRLVSFIPQLQQANAELETDPDAATKQIDNVDDDEEQYIEMALGLGVLTEKPAAKDASGVRTTRSEESDVSDINTSASEDEAGTINTQVSIVDKLKKIKPAKRKIEEVG